MGSTEDCRERARGLQPGLAEAGRSWPVLAPAQCASSHSIWGTSTQCHVSELAQHPHSSHSSLRLLKADAGICKPERNTRPSTCHAAKQEFDQLLPSWTGFKIHAQRLCRETTLQQADESLLLPVLSEHFSRLRGNVVNKTQEASALGVTTIREERHYAQNQKVK